MMYSYSLRVISWIAGPTQAKLPGHPVSILTRGKIPPLNSLAHHLGLVPVGTGSQFVSFVKNIIRFQLWALTMDYTPWFIFAKKT